MAISLTVAYVKSHFLTDMTTADFDTVLGELITDVVGRAVEYINDDDITAQATLPAELLRPLAKQVSYEFRRKKDPGLQSTSFPDGSVNKFSDDEWLPDVLGAIKRHTYFSLGDQES